MPYFLRSLIPYLVCACLLTSLFCLLHIHQFWSLLHCCSLYMRIKTALFIEFQEKHIFLVEKWKTKQPYNFYFQSSVFDRNLMNTNFSLQLSRQLYSPLGNHSSAEDFVVLWCSLAEKQGSCGCHDLLIIYCSFIDGTFLKQLFLHGTMGFSDYQQACQLVPVLVVIFVLSTLVYYELQANFV